MSGQLRHLNHSLCPVQGSQGKQGMLGLPGIDGPPVSAATGTLTVIARMHIFKGKSELLHLKQYLLA